MRFHEFQIGAWQVAEDEVQVTVFNSPVGVLRRPERVKVDLKEMDGRIAGCFSQWDEPSKDGGQDVSELGKMLAQIILPNPISKMMAQSLERVHPGDGLRVRLCMDEALTDLPWEYISAPEMAPISGFLALNPRISIVREAPLMSKELSPSMKKQRMVFSGTFRQDGVDQYGVEREYQGLKKELDQVGDLISISFIHSSNANIQKALSTKADIFYYSGDVVEIDGKLYLVMEIPTDLSKPGISETIDSETLAAMLQRAGTKLAMFSACNSGRWSFAKALVEAGIPITIGVHKGIFQDDAITFANLLFRTLALGLSLDEAVTWARLSLRGPGKEMKGEIAAWGSFVVYMPSGQAVVFPRPKGSEIDKRQKITLDNRERAIMLADPNSIPPPDQERYVNFDLLIAANGHVIARSPQGEAAADIPVEIPGDIREALEQVRLRKFNPGDVRRDGKSLYDWILPSSIHGHLVATEAVARNEKAKLRLRLQIEAPSIASIPLEMLYRESGKYFLAINPDTVLSRYLELPLPPELTRRREGALHMLAIIADPADMPSLRPDEWEALLESALAGPLKDGRMTLKVVKNATREEIRNALLERKPDIVQFIGYGTLKDGKGNLALVNKDTGNTWWVDEEGFASLFLGYDDHLGLICLATGESIGFASLLVQRGAPAVIAMQYALYVKTAKVFLEDLYTSVAARKPIDWAVQSARRAVALECGQDDREFVTPVLYMRAKDGNIF